MITKTVGYSHPGTQNEEKLVVIASIFEDIHFVFERL